jgi:hypothetical protein
MIVTQETKTPLSTDTILYLGAALLALSIRLLNLGKAPLSDAEAGWALQALDVARGNSPIIGAQPAYVLFTGLLFAIFKETNALARLVSALAGSSLVLLPFILSGNFNLSGRLRLAGIILAFGFALDPGLVAASRSAGSLIPAVAFTLLALALFLRHKVVASGILMGLALLSGPGILQGFTGMVLAYAVSTVIVHRSKVNFTGLLGEPAESYRSRVKIFAATTLITVGCCGTLFLAFPQGLAGFGQMIPAYLQGWVTPSDVPSLRLPVSLLFYQPLVVLFGILGVITSWLPAFPQTEEGSIGKDGIKKLGQASSLWLAAALILNMLYPGRVMEDQLWVLVPFWVLAAIELSRYLELDLDEIFLPSAIGLAALMTIFFIMIWYNLLRLSIYQANLTYYLILIGSIFLMAVIISILVAAGWSTHTALQGLVWGISLVLGIYTVFQTWGLSQLRTNSPRELWHYGPAISQADLLNQTLVDLSTWDTGLRHELDITVTADLPSLRWALREFPHVHFKNVLDEQELSPVIITPGEQTSPSLVASYRGQDFIWQINAGWSGVIPSGNLVRWIAFREAPEIHQRIILWGRNDLFPGGGLEPSSIVVPLSPPVPPVEEESPPQDKNPIE